MLTHLFAQFGLGCSKWLKQLVLGFPITGLLSQSGAYPVASRVDVNILSPEQLFDSSFDRFQQRATRAMPNKAAERLAEALGQVEKGWISQPVAVNEKGPAYFPPGRRY